MEFFKNLFGSGKQEAKPDSKEEPEMTDVQPKVEEQSDSEDLGLESEESSEDQSKNQPQ